MAEDTTTPDVIEDDIADVSLTDAPDLVADSTTESGDTAEQAENEGADTGTEVEEDGKAPDAPATEADSQESNEQQDAPQQTKAERDQAAARAWQERQRQRQQVAQQLDETYGPKSQDELIQEGLPPEEARFEALRQEMAYKEQRTQIAELNASMVTEATEVMSDMPVFRATNPDGTPNPDYDPQFAQAVEQQYRLASRLETDDKGIILNAEVPLYDFYKQMYDIYQSGTSRGVQKGQELAQSMISRTENPGGSSSTSGNQSDDLDSMEERLGNVRIA
jgi:hypothetical protein